MNVPQHIAIILDGNGRWAKAKGMPRNYGHAQGSKNVEKICEAAYKMGVKYLTVYALSLIHIFMRTRRIKSISRKDFCTMESSSSL